MNRASQVKAGATLLAVNRVALARKPLSTSCFVTYQGELYSYILDFGGSAVYKSGTRAALFDLYKNIDMTQTYNYEAPADLVYFRSANQSPMEVYVPAYRTNGLAIEGLIAHYINGH